jgi:(2Fe-2S) ferredoxin
MVYPEGVWYRLTDIAQADEIIQEHLVNGRIVEHLVHRRLDPGNRSKGVTPIKVPARA